MLSSAGYGEYRTLVATLAQLDRNNLAGHDELQRWCGKTAKSVAGLEMLLQLSRESACTRLDAYVTGCDA